ncbi:RNA polymerase sigma factor [Pseudoxanthomonas sp. 22568]|uniref:RNA polymerase sigma factor n=1 Tax=Pseudoxanthomonas sp. 22568 TaxID=3453945 RepID=UPI003F85ED8C
MSGAAIASIEDLMAARAGDAAALQRVLAISRQNLRRYAEYHCVVNDAEDAVQESLLLVSRRIGDLRAVEAFTSWLFRIVKRECNRLKRGLRLLTGEAVTEDLLPPTHFEPVELGHDVARVLETLPAHYRQILLLRDLEGMTIEELAEQLQLTPQAVKSRLHRARALAREYLCADPTLP